ncbi:MAG: ATP-binding protein, partial [bacterium]|nr:ATP-binding protein [bacterium]
LVKERTEKLVESEEKFRLIFENARDAIFLADPLTGLITNCNKAAELLLEKERDEIIGHHQAKIHPPEKAEIYMNMFKKHIEHKGWAEDEAEVITKSGNIKPVLITATVTLIKEKPIIQGIFRDITERKQMEKELIKTERLAAAVQIASEAAHEVKNPLTVIKTGLYYLGKILPEDNNEAKKTISQMDRATQRAVVYINDLLDFAKPIELKKSEVSINEMIKQALDELPAEIFSNIDVQQELASGLPGILADFNRLEQVVINLVKNATEAMGGVKSGELRVKSEREGEFVKIIVSDTGKGIAEEDLKRIFDPFFTTKGKGTGLGLAICQRIVEAHDGEIEVASKMGEGTTFVVRLPAVQQAAVKLDRG